MLHMSSIPFMFFKSDNECGKRNRVNVSYLRPHHPKRETDIVYYPISDLMLPCGCHMIAKYNLLLTQILLELLMYEFS